MSPFQQQSLNGNPSSAKLRAQEVAVLKLLKIKKPSLSTQLKRSIKEVRR
jgi:hypothetical protein